MRNHDNLGKMLGAYNVPDATEADISRVSSSTQNALVGMRYGKSSLRALVLNQIKYISPLLWVTQILAVMLLGVLSGDLRDPYPAAQRILFALTPLTTIFAVPEFIKSIVYGMSELENTCKNRAARVFYARLILIGGTNIALIVLMAAMLSSRYSLPFCDMFLYGLIPFNAANLLNFLTFDLMKTRSSFSSIAMSIGSAMLINVLTYFAPFDGINMVAWGVVFVGTTALTLAEMNRFLRSLTDKEDSLQWN